MNRNVMLAPLVLGLVLSASAQSHKQLKYTVGPGASVMITNEFGPITVKPSTGHQVTIMASPHSTNVEVDADQLGNRIEVRSHIVKPGSDDDSQVEYDVSVPSDAMLTIRADAGPVQIEGLRGDVSVVGDNAHVDVKDVSGAHVRVQTVSGPVTLTNVSKGHVEIATVGGDVKLNGVTGPKVSVNSTRGNIAYAGDFGNAGDYDLVSHSGNIDVSLPETASVELSARSVSGSVENDFPLQQKAHTAWAPQPGKSFIGTANSAASSVELRTFSGKIRVKKQ
jgi:DUF4097 and DUF4098 domain-containing protein YvlB